MRDDIGERPVEDALPVEGAFELKEWTVAFVGSFFGKRKCLFAAHGVVATGVAE